MDLKTALLLSSLSIVLFIASWRLPKRPGHRQDCWGPTRGFARIKKACVDTFGIPEAYALLITECASGVLHAPWIFLVLYVMPGVSVESAQWAAALVFAFWTGIGFGRASSSENRRHRNSV